MNKIGGNIEAILQVYVPTTNEIGESVKVWHDVVTLKGYLDLSGGDSKRTVYNSKIEESTHVFICDFKPILETILIGGKSVRVNVENTRMAIKNKLYDVLLIDNPMELNYHYEIFLKYTGGYDE